ncbi:MAG: Fe-S cluster assembly ATPase SufC [Candidatus Ancillula sp.]|jgi:Fe-S cluster assembly ATP-binding protein|nr:Fe-S cluster assembly ATPase SufC [Candidatus Ancillula sp.]
MHKLTIDNLSVAVEGKEILKGVELEINSGETHAIMGPNGSGKSTLAYTIAGHPSYEITGGSIRFDGHEVNDMPPEERARLGVFLAQQLPTEIDGITLSNFLRAAKTAVSGSAPKVREWVKTLQSNMEELDMDPTFAGRSVNVGFSGGEKKRAEILQLKVLEPKIAILDETDSGLDVDALKIVARGVNDAQKKLNFGALLITHHTHLLQYIKPDFVHVFTKGRIVESGSGALASELVARGYSRFNN